MTSDTKDVQVEANKATVTHVFECLSAGKPEWVVGEGDFVAWRSRGKEPMQLVQDFVASHDHS